MEYRIEELARAAGVAVGTVRFYQSRGLLPRPRRAGRVALYGDEHLERIARIRALNRRGLTLEGVRRALAVAPTDGGASASLLQAIEETEGERRYDRAQLAAAVGLPEILLAQAEQAGLLQPLERDGEAPYTEADRSAVLAARRLLDSGMPLHELLPLAVEHARHTQELADRAVELFRRSVRLDPADGSPRPSEEVTAAFRELLPAVTTLVALFFQRTLVSRARAALARSGEEGDLRDALAATESARLRVSWS
jgi:DNA-binding transcriptional MerR regulator